MGPELGALLVELGAARDVVGVDSASNAIPELAHAFDLGEPDAPSLERARALDPDIVLVLAEPEAPAARFAAALGEAGVSAHMLAPRDANEVLEAVHRVGRLVGRELRARVLAARLAREVSEIATRRDGRRRAIAAWVLEDEPLVVVGGSGLLHELLELAGAENSFHGPDDETFAISQATLDASAPDIVLLPRDIALTVSHGTRVAVAPGLAAKPLLDLPARVRALHEVLYPAEKAP